MIVGLMSASFPPGVSAEPMVRTFVARALTMHRLRAMRSSVVLAGLPFACVSALASLWSIQLAAWLLLITLLAVVLLVAIRQQAIARQVARQHDVAVRGIGAQGFEDELRTWLEREGPNQANGMSEWLLAELALAVLAKPEPQLRTNSFRLGGIRYLFPLLVVLLLLKLMLPDLSVALPGLFAQSGRGSVASSNSGEKQRDNGGAASAETDEKAKQTPSATIAPPPPIPDPPADDPADEPPQKPEPSLPAPLLQLPNDPRVVVPQFIGDGPTRRAMADVVLVPDGFGATADLEGQTGNGPLPQQKTQAEKFAKAAEKAQQSRHVLPVEQRIVKRFFALLMAGDK